jgi:hypothetical protein
VNDGTSFFLLGYMTMKNTRIIRILCLCSSMVVWLLWFSLKKETKMKWRMMPRKNESIYLPFDLNGFTYEFIGPQTNNILLITWGNELRDVQISHYWPLV